MIKLFYIDTDAYKWIKICDMKIAYWLICWLHRNLNVQYATFLILDQFSFKSY